MNDWAAVDTSATPASPPCPGCGGARAGRDRFCERCGHDFLRPSCTWSVLVSPDREYFGRSGVVGLSFPVTPVAARLVVLTDSPVRIGRGRVGADIEVEGDPAVSRLHASLVRQDDGTWAVADEGSSNGTTVNDDPRALPPHVLVPLHDGDRVHLGAWTTVAVSVDGEAPVRTPSAAPPGP